MILNGEYTSDEHLVSVHFWGKYAREKWTRKARENLRGKISMDIYGSTCTPML